MKIVTIIVYILDLVVFITEVASAAS